MTMDGERFREYLLVYGADVQRWPEAIREAGLAALEQGGEYRSFQADHAQFEAVLSARRYEEPSPDLEQRIIAAARRREREAPLSLSAFLATCLAEIRFPQPVLTAVAVLIVGFVLGFLLPAGLGLVEPGQTDFQEFLYASSEVP